MMLPALCTHSIFIDQVVIIRQVLRIHMIAHVVIVGVRGKTVLHPPPPHHHQPHHQPPPDVLFIVRFVDAGERLPAASSALAVKILAHSTRETVNENELAAIQLATIVAQ